MRKLAALVTGRRSKWVIIALWFIAVFAMVPLGSKLADETRDDTASFLPESAESTEVAERLSDDFDTGETAQGLIVYQREGGLTGSDAQKIAADAKAIEDEAAKEDSDVVLTGPPEVPFQQGSSPGLVSDDREVAYTVDHGPQ